MEEEINLTVDAVTQLVSVDDPDPTLSVLWDRAVQAAVIDTGPGPTIASRAYALTHTAIFDAWAQFDTDAVATTIGDDLQVGAELMTDEFKALAMSQAALDVLINLFPDQEEDFYATFVEATGIDPRVTVFPPDSPIPGVIAIGAQVATALIAARSTDGSNQDGGYADTTGYTPFNPSPPELIAIDRWTPENVPIDPVDTDPEQSFLTPHWGTVTPFGLSSGDALRPEAPEPFFLPGVDATLNLTDGTITLTEGGATNTVPVTPDLIGTVINPAFIAQTQQVIDFSANLTDEQKLIAEFWEDGGGTSFPPGTWMTFGQFVSARDGHDLDTDAQLFFALGNAVFDAGIATWEAKVFYDYARPVRVVRDLGTLGLIGEEGTDALTGETGFVIDAWAGPGLGTQTILAENFLTYQTPGSDPSPPFAEYTSGHSAFSAAGAEVLRLFSTSDAFGGSLDFAAGESRFEPGVTPVDTVTLAWDTFTAAADEAGISRLYGGIHFEDGDLNGRSLGSEVGEAAFRSAFAFISGADAGDPSDPELAAATGVARFYESFFGRVTDFAGLNFWADASVAGLSDSNLASAFLGSQELADAGGGDLSDDALLDLLFGNVGIDRASSDLDDALASRLSAGEERADVVADFVGGAEVADATTYLASLEEGEAGSYWFV